MITTPKMIPFHKWDEILNFNTAKEQVESLLHPVEVVESEKEIFLHHKPSSHYRMAYEDVLSNFVTMGEFTYELYLATPYFVEIYKTWKQKQDFQWQLLFLILIGYCLSTDFPYNHFSKELNESLPKEIIENHLCSIKIMQEETKMFLSKHLEKLKQLSHFEVQHLCQCLFAILGNREASYIFFISHFNGCSITCPHCSSFDNNFETHYCFDHYISDKKSIHKPPKEIQPAPSVIGQWDQKSYDNDYLWLSNLLYLLGNDKDAQKLSYYYGTFTCPHCGKTDIIIDLAKYTMIQNTELDLL